MKKISILFVEDNLSIQNQLSKFLSRFCTILYLANDGKEGLEIYYKEKPDMVISDIKMPNLDGLEMVRLIKDDNPDLPIVFTTAFDDRDYFQKAIEMQVNGYILKPIDLNLLEKKIEDIKQSLELKEELNYKNHLLIQQSKLASMGEMLANIIHQWRQPLATISAINLKNHINIDMNQLNPRSMIKQTEEIERQIEYLTDTIEDFRNFYQPIPASHKTFEVGDQINKCINLIKASFYDNEIELISSFCNDNEIAGDPRQLSQVLINILNNARYVLSHNTDLDKKVVLIHTKVENDNLIISIQDNGGGIADTIIEEIFKPYFTTKSEVDGTGLGLYIVNSIIINYFKGKITASNEEFEYEGKIYTGAKFSIALPLPIEGHM